MNKYFKYKYLKYKLKYQTLIRYRQSGGTLIENMNQLEEHPRRNLLTYIKFYDSFNQPINPGKLPPNLK